MLDVKGGEYEAEGERQINAITQRMLESQELEGGLLGSMLSVAS